VKYGKLIIAILAAGVAANIYDFVVHGLILGSTVYERYTQLFRTDMPMAWMVVADFVAAAVFVIVYARVYQSFGGGLKGGATFGLYAGLLASFPTWIITHFLINGFTYELAWIWTIAGIVWGVIVGTVAGLLYKQ
jgi:hypothetical protein